MVHDTPPLFTSDAHTLPAHAPSQLREHLLFYLIACLSTLALASWYLLSRASGSNSAWVGLPLDDNWIHLTYARSLAEQGWFFYNPGVAEGGMSSPLWVMLLALVSKIAIPLGASPQWCAKGLGLLFAVGIPLMTYHLVRALHPDRRIAVVAGFLILFEPNLAYGAVAGMEVALFTFLTLLALWLSLRQQYVLTGIVLGLSVITRAEGVLNAVIIGALPLLREYARREQNTLITPAELRLVISLFAPALVLGGAWALFNYSVSGQVFPNTYYVKHNFALGYFNTENLQAILAGYLAHLALFKGPMLLVSLVLGGIAVYTFYDRQQLSQVAVLFLIPLVQLYAFSINIKVAADALPWTYFTRRYMDFLLPLWVIMLVIGATGLWDLAARWRNRAVQLVLPLVIWGGVLLIGMNFFQLNRYFVEEYSWNTRNVEETQVVMGQWMRDNIPAHATIAVTDAGAMRYWSRPDHIIIDFLGLNCHTCIGRPAEELLNEFKPVYVVFFTSANLDSQHFEKLHTIVVEHNTILGGNELVAARVLSLPPSP